MNRFYDRKNVLITGGSRGIGAAIAHEFAKNNYNIIVNYVNKEETARKLCEELQTKYGVEAIAIKADVSKEEEVKKMVAKVISEYQKIDCLINNAGIAIDSTLEDKTVDNFHNILDVNLIGPFLMMKYAGEHMVKEGHGSIVNISSTNGIDSYYPYSMDYDASKAGVISLTHNFAVEYAPHIQVNCVAPGWTNTEALQEMDEEVRQKEYNHILLKRFAEPEEIAKAVYFAATTSYLNDSIIKIDGGRC